MIEITEALLKQIHAAALARVVILHPGFLKKRKGEDYRS